MKKKYIPLIIVNGISLLLFAVMCIAAAGIKNSLADQHAVSRWTDGTERYSQISVFTDALNGMNIDSVFMTRVDVDKKLVENSLVSEQANARLWADAFSFSSGKMSISTEHGTAESRVIVTGGDFFLFHPLKLISGYYYSDGDLMHDRVLIDETLAWQLYGSSDIAGMPVVIGGKYFYIAGVYERPDGDDMEKLLGTSPLMFLPYQGNELLGNENIFTCYEACLPNPVSGLAEKIIGESVSVSEENRITAENSARYNLKNRFEVLKNYRMRSVRDNPIVYPYWENAAQISDDTSAVILVVQMISLAAPTASVIGYIIYAYRKRKVVFEKLVNAAKRIFNKIALKFKRERKIADE